MAPRPMKADRIFVRVRDNLIAFELTNDRGEVLIVARVPPRAAIEIADRIVDLVEAIKSTPVGVKH